MPWQKCMPIGSPLIIVHLMVCMPVMAYYLIMNLDNEIYQQETNLMLSHLNVGAVSIVLFAN